uniref:sphingosine kinase n=1 Tax=Labrus bergylta TaxID=56723 RepID=A0A3Q3GRQ9_9LABR
PHPLGGPKAALSRPCRMMLLVNPQSGKGEALTLYNNHIQRMLNEAGVPHTLVITEHQNHARELVREADLSQWDALVIMSGDGLLFEVINGLLEREDWEDAIRTPLGILPGGSGNALAASIHHYSRSSPVSSEELLLSCGFLLCKGLVSRMDLVSVQLSSGPRLFSFLSLAWGFVADVDIESEKYRHVGAARFTVGTLVRLASLRVYRGRLAYLPSTPSRSPHKAPRGPPDSLLPPLDQQLPGDWVLVQEEDFVLMLAMYHSHLAEDLLAAPGAAPDDGVIHLFYLFLAMEKGEHLGTICQHLVYVKVRALRLDVLPKDHHAGRRGGGVRAAAGRVRWVLSGLDYNPPSCNIWVMFTVREVVIFQSVLLFMLVFICQSRQRFQTQLCDWLFSLVSENNLR